MNRIHHRSITLVLFFSGLLLVPATLHAQNKTAEKKLVMEGLKCNMTQTEVKKLLKEPGRIEDSPFGVYWVYAKPSIKVTLSDNPDFKKKLPEAIVTGLWTNSPSTKITVDGKAIKVGGKLSDLEAVIGKNQKSDWFGINETIYSWFDNVLNAVEKDGKIISISIDRPFNFK